MYAIPKPGRTVPIPGTRKLLNPAGQNIGQVTQYWHRRHRDGDVTLSATAPVASPPASSPPAPAAPTPATPAPAPAQAASPAAASNNAAPSATASTGSAA